jgi:hypothetical protein
MCTPQRQVYFPTRATHWTIREEGNLKFHRLCRVATRVPAKRIFSKAGELISPDVKVKNLTLLIKSCLIKISS